MDMTTSSLWQPFLMTIAKLSLVLALLILMLYLMKRFMGSQGQMAERGMIKVMASIHIGPKQRIVLLEVLGEKILIGVSAQQITHLTEIKGEYPELTAASSTPAFKRFLKMAGKGSKTPDNKQAREIPPE